MREKKSFLTSTGILNFLIALVLFGFKALIWSRLSLIDDVLYRDCTGDYKSSL